MATAGLLLAQMGPTTSDGGRQTATLRRVEGLEAAERGKLPQDQDDLVLRERIQASVSA
ncbi:MAG TPA: hypothetical protein VGM27_30605 [Acidobacteriaceae bacterium]